jgi:hypothetical protein
MNYEGINIAWGRKRHGPSGWQILDITFTHEGEVPWFEPDNGEQWVRLPWLDVPIDR